MIDGVKVSYFSVMDKKTNLDCSSINYLMFTMVNDLDTSCGKKPNQIVPGILICYIAHGVKVSYFIIIEKKLILIVPGLFYFL